jgi:hypothetical protein
MIVYLNADGIIEQVVPQNLTQGSNNETLIVIGANLSDYTSLNAIFKLPNKQVLAPRLMTKQDSDYVLNNEIVNVWTCKINKSITNFSGTLELTIDTTDVNGVKVNSYTGAVQIAPTNAPSYPKITESAEDIFNQIFEAYGYIQGKLAEKQDIYDEDLQTNSKDVVGAINELNAKGIQNSGDIAGLTADIEEVRTDIEEISTNIDNIELEIDRINLNVEDNSRAINGLNISINNLDAEVNTNTQDIQRNTSSINELRSEISNVKTNYATKTYVENLYAELSIGGHKSLVFDTKQQFLNWLAGTYQRTDGVLPSNLGIGDVILIKEQGVPDYWVSSISSPMTINNFSEYEVKIDLSDYATLEQLNALSDRVEVVEENLTQITPDVARALKTPMSAPITTKLVAVDTTNSQEMVTIGNNLILENGILSATGGGSGGTSDYENLTNKPQINGVTLIGNKTSANLGLITENDLPQVIRVPAGV